MKISQIAGWYGTCVVVLAYALLSFGILSAHNFWYQFLNLTGAFGIVVDTYYKKDYPPEVLNLIWMGIAAFSLVEILFFK